MADAENLILIAVGPDQVGLVRKISEFIVQGGGNIEDSRMAVLAGEFALIVLISGERSRLSAIAAKANQLGQETGLTVSVKQPAGKKKIEGGLAYQLVASCMDHPGFVHRLSSVLSHQGINIESMETQKYAAPVTGAPMFRMEALITIPGGVNVGALNETFEQMEREQNINIDLMPVSVPTLQ